MNFSTMRFMPVKVSKNVAIFTAACSDRWAGNQSRGLLEAQHVSARGDMYAWKASFHQVSFEGVLCCRFPMD